RRRRAAAPARADRRRPRDPPRARRAGEVAGVGHAAADRVAPLRHLGHPLELPRDQDTHPGELLGHQLFHHRGMLEEATSLAFRFVIGKSNDKSKMAALEREVEEYDDFVLLDLDLMF
uniref:Uncharacterized protein n=1 Tax=Aegilops tauschii subsp. strangulata TaxID=200361 RepID=A0A452ZTH6_AEGTS